MEYITNIKSNRNTNIVSTISIPDNKDSFPLVLMAHGFCANRDESGAFSSLANKLAESVIASIRIDFPGCNDSKESYLSNTIDNDVEDLRCAYKYMNDNYNITSTGIVGYSLGAKVITHYVAKYNGINVIMVFAPAITNNLDWNSSLTLGKQKEMEKALEIANEQGYYNYLNEFDNVHIPLSKDFIKQCLTYKTLDNFSDFAIPTLMIYGNNDDIIPLNIYKEIIKENHNPLFNSYLINGANHGFGMWDRKPEQFNELINKAHEFLVQELPAQEQTSLTQGREAFYKLRQQASTNNIGDMTIDKINSEIDSYRKGRN